jgi:hypothetical protein
MKKPHLETLLILGGLLSVLPARAESVPKLAQCIEQKLDQIEGALGDLELDPSAQASAWTLQDLNLDFQPELTFGVPGVLSLTVTPEIDLVLVPSTPPSH